VWSLKEHNCIAKLAGHSSAVTNIVHLKDLNANYLASCSQDTSVRIWDISTKQEKTLLKSHTDIVFGLIYPGTFNPKYLVSSGNDMKIKLWEISLGHLVKDFTEHSDAVLKLLYLKGLSINEFFLSAGNDKKIKLWDLQKLGCAATFATKEPVVVMKHLKKLNPALFASGGLDKVVNVWNALTGECIKTLTGFSSAITNIVYPKQIDEEIIVVSDLKNIKVYNFHKGTLLKSIDNAHEEMITCMMYTKDKEIYVNGFAG